MSSKLIILGDSHTFYMSSDPRKKYFLKALHEENIELYPMYWVSFANDPDGKTVYCWRMATAARTLTAEIIDQMLKQDKSILDVDKTNIHLVFALGTLDLLVRIRQTKDPIPVAETYFDIVHAYCLKNGFTFSFASPVYNDQSPKLLDEFNSTIARMCKLHGISQIITYPPEIPYKKFYEVDRFHHASFEIMESVASHIKSVIY